MEYDVKMIAAIASDTDQLVIAIKFDDPNFVGDIENFTDGSVYVEEVVGNNLLGVEPGIYKINMHVVETTTGGWSEPEETEYDVTYTGHELLYRLPEEW